MSKRAIDVAVIGAGPYGLSAVAHLRSAGIETAVFGEVMESWRQNMPVGMLLRSTPRASSISDPSRALTLERFGAAEGVALRDPLPLETFVAYGRWFQEAVAPDLDTRRVRQLESAGERFRLTLADGDTVLADRVVVAAGIASSARRPPELEQLPATLVSHSCELRDVSRYAGRRVAVIGAGQSALESAALLHEGGADVELLARARRISWLPERFTKTSALRELLHRLLYPPTEVGPPGLNWIAAAPDVFRRLPGTVRAEITQRCLQPVGIAWLRPRLTDTKISTGRSIVSASEKRGSVNLVLDDGSRREVDHVVAGTGYRAEVSSYRFLGPDLQGGLAVVAGHPRLRTGFETSVPGLHVIGGPAAWSFGPLMRFVVGTWFSAEALTRTILGRPPAFLRFSF
jgi:cation diffusion facilitator CzcD-associated flavoprotein CzcO